MSAPRTGFRKIDNVIEFAENLGLVVEVEDKSRETEFSGLQHSFSLEIRVPVPEHLTDMLAVYQRAESVHLHFCWFPGPGATPKLMGATDWQLAKHEDLHKVAKKYKGLSVYRIIGIRLERMGDEVRYNAERGRV